MNNSLTLIWQAKLSVLVYHYRLRSFIDRLQGRRIWTFFDLPQWRTLKQWHYSWSTFSTHRCRNENSHYDDIFQINKIDFIQNHYFIIIFLIFRWFLTVFLNNVNSKNNLFCTITSWMDQLHSNLYFRSLVILIIRTTHITVKQFIEYIIIIHNIITIDFFYFHCVSKYDLIRLHKTQKIAKYDFPTQIQ